MPDVAAAVCMSPGVAYRIERGGQVIAHALALGNGRWSLVDRHDALKLTVATFESPDAAAAYAERKGIGR